MVLAVALNDQGAALSSFAALLLSKKGNFMQ